MYVLSHRELMTQEHSTPRRLRYLRNVEIYKQACVRKERECKTPPICSYIANQVNNSYSLGIIKDWEEEKVDRPGITLE